MKKLLSIVLCIVMVLSLSVTAFASTDCTTCGEITGNSDARSILDANGNQQVVCPDCYAKYYCADCECLVLGSQSHKAGCSTLPVAPSVASSTGTEVTFTGTQSETYTVTVPASVTVKASGDAVKGQVTVAGTWASNRKVVVTADESVTLTNSISGGDPKTLDVDFDGISKVGDNNVAIKTTDDGASAIFTVANIEDALFGTWTGKFNYEVSMQSAKPQLSDCYSWEIWYDGEGYLIAPEDAELVADYYSGSTVGSGTLVKEDMLVFSRTTYPHPGGAKTLNTGDPCWFFNAEDGLKGTNSYFEIYDKSGKYEGKVYSPVSAYDYCFIAGTKVTVSLDGKTTNIEDLSVGDEVVAYDFATGENYITKVVKTKALTSNRIVEIKFTDGTSLTCTPSHPIAKTDGTWVSAIPDFYDVEKEYASSQLYVGDEIVTVDGTKEVENVIDYLYDAKPVYSITVEGRGDMVNNNYYADGVLAHNTPC